MNEIGGSFLDEAAKETKKREKKSMQGIKNALQSLHERMRNNPEIIQKTLIDNYEKSITEPAQEYTEREVINRGKPNQGMKETACTLKRGEFVVTFHDKQAVTFTITFVRFKNGGDIKKISLVPQKRNNEVYTIEEGKIIGSNFSTGSSGYPPNTILGYTYDQFNKALLASKPRVTTPTKKQEKKEEVRVKPVLPEALTSKYEFLNPEDFKALLASTSVETTKKETEKLLKKYGYIGLLTYMQVKDGIITLDQADKIVQGYANFKSMVLTEYTTIKNDPRQLQNIDAYGQLVNIKSRHAKVVIYALLRFFQKAVKYEKDTVVGRKGKLIEPGRTFAGFEGYIDANPPRVILMDCDIMSIVAADICRSQGVSMNFLVNYDPATSRPNHANTQIEDTVIERTNAQNRGVPQQKIQYVGYTGTSLIGKFFHTYAQAPEEKKSTTSLDIQKSFIEFSLGTLMSSARALTVDIHNFFEESSAIYANIPLSDYEYIAALLLEFRKQAKEKFGDEKKYEQYPVLKREIDAQIKKIIERVSQVKAAKKTYNYTKLDMLIKKLQAED